MPSWKMEFLVNVNATCWVEAKDMLVDWGWSILPCNPTVSPVPGWPLIFEGAMVLLHWLKS